MSIKFVQSPILYQAGSGSIVGATQVVLTSLTDIYGNVLTMSDFGAKGYGTAEPDTVNAEGFTFTGVTANANGTYTLTGVSTILAKSPYTETSGLVRQHSGGTKVVITDNVAFWNTFGNTANTNTWADTQTFSVPAVQATEPTLSTQVANKSYVDSVAIAGAPKATDTVYGITKLSVAAVSPTAPIAVGDNDGRVPTQSENDALVGTSGTPSSTNKYVTNDDTSTTASGSKLPRGVAGKIATGWVDTGTGANQIVQLNGSSQLPAVDGSNLTGINLFKAGVTTRAGSAGSGNQTIAHGLGKAPKYIKIVVLWQSNSANSNSTSYGTYDGTTMTNVSLNATSSTPASTSTSRVAFVDGGGGATQTATVTFDATNITLAWTHAGSLNSANMAIHWEANA